MQKLYTTIFYCLLTIGVITFTQAQHTHIHDMRCGTVEMDAHYRQNNPNEGSIQDFERWLEPHVQAYKDAANQGYRAPVITIPVIFHVITDGGGVDNLSAAQIQAQLDQLNIDFRNLAGSTHPNAADTEVQFCLATLDPNDNLLAEPGINRVTTYGDGPFSDNFINNTVKPATIWNPDDYMNIWAAQLNNGLLGWAQFPTNSGLAGMPANGGAANTDGVVVGSATVGSIANPNPAGGAYTRGRTLTHEVGHWVGLRHIWGDGNCAVDDFCGDTPNAGGANYGCPTGQNTCGSVDMIENYMDYTDDACMNIFTEDQKARVRTVLNICPRRASLANSTKCGVPAPTIGFVSGGGTVVNEGTGCNFQDVTLTLNIAQAPSANATVTFTTTGTATSGVDYDVIPASVVFPAGSTPTRQVTLRIYNDGIVEPNETLLVSFNVTTTGDAVAATGDLLDHDITINDDDIAPNPTNMTTLLNVDFESGFGGFTTQGASATDFLIGNLAALTSLNWTLNNTNTTNFAYTNDDGCNNCNKNNDRLTSPTFSLAGAYTVATLTFDHAFADINGNIAGTNVDETGEVQINTGGAWTTIMNLTNNSVGAANDFYTTPWQTGVTVNLTPYIGQANVQIRFRYRDGGEWAYGMAVDNVVVTAGTPMTIQTAESPTEREIEVRGMQTVHFFDATSGNVMATIQNLSNWNYQCTEVEVDRDAAGVGAPTAPFKDAIAANAVTAKTFYVDPTNNTPTGSYTITLYYTEAEIAAWEAATGKSRTALKIIKVANNEISDVNPGNYNSYQIEQQPATIGAFGTDLTFTATFNSGFSGFTLGDPNIILLPMNLLSFGGEVVNKDIALTWETTNEQDVDYYTLEKSMDGIDFQLINQQSAQGNGKAIDNVYNHLDNKATTGTHYYRLGQVDLDGNQTYSKTIAITIEEETRPVLTFAPNPASEYINIEYMTPRAGEVSLEIYDIVGHNVLNNANLSVDAGENNIHLNVKDYPEGMYILRVKQGEYASTKRFVKR